MRFQKYPDTCRRGLRKENSNAIVRPSELKPLEYNVPLLCKAQEKGKNLQFVIVILNFFENFVTHETILSAIFQSQPAKHEEVPKRIR